MRPLLTAIAYLVCFVTPAWGEEFEVNSFTPGFQENPKVSPLGGGFVVAWSGSYSSGTDTSDNSVHARLFDAEGMPKGLEFQVNTYTTDSQRNPAVGLDSSGGFVVAWRSSGSDGTDQDAASVQAQRYDATGTPVGSQFQVNTYTTENQIQITVGPTGGPGFVIAWRSDGSNGTDSDGESILAQRYLADGTPDGGEFQVNTYTTGDQEAPSIGSDGNGGFVIVWQSQGSAGTDQSGSSIQAQRYDADGIPQGAQFQVNDFTSSTQADPRVGLSGSGGFVVAWESFASPGTDTDGNSIQARRFSSNGTPFGDQVQVNTYTISSQNQPTVAPDDDGFSVTWHSSGGSGTDTDGASIQAQRYDSEGDSSGAQFQVNQFTPDGQSDSFASADGSGGFVVVWESDGSAGVDTDGASILGRRYRGRLVFADGFESGDTAAWSSTVP